MAKQAKYQPNAAIVEMSIAKYQYLLESTSNGRIKYIRHLFNLEDIKNDQQVSAFEISALYHLSAWSNCSHTFLP